MTKSPQTTVYARNTGLEIGPYEKRTDGRPVEGRIGLRFFRLESGAAALRFVAEPAEAFDLYCKIHRICREGGRESLNHKFEGSEGEVLTRLNLERFERYGSQGYAFSIQRGEEEINVPLSAERFLFSGEFLRHLSLLQSWVGAPERESTDG
ncbi:MAG: hypothetical protein P8Z70_01070 [Desulfuromonadales bacterium]